MELEEISLRLRDAEKELSRLRALVNSGSSNPFVDAVLTAPGAPPQVTGVALAENVGSINVTWNAVGISNLKRYEIQIATDNLFESLVKQVSSTQLFYQFVDGVLGTRYFARVRAVNTENAVSPWSSAIPNTVLAKIQTTDVEVNALSRVGFNDTTGYTLNAPAAWQNVVSTTVLATADDIGRPITAWWGEVEITNSFTGGPGSTSSRLQIRLPDLSLEYVDAFVSPTFSARLTDQVGTYTYTVQLSTSGWTGGSATYDANVLAGIWKR